MTNIVLFIVRRVRAYSCITINGNLITPMSDDDSKHGMLIPAGMENLLAALEKIIY